MTEATQETRKERTALFGRSYDHAKGEGKFEIAGHPDATTIVNVASLPDAVRNSFALLGVMDFAAQAGNKIKRDGGTVADALKALNDALQRAVAGTVEFTSGIGMGMASAPATLLVGRALVETGRKFTVWNGTRYDFEGDVSKAQDAMKALYEDTTEREIVKKDGSKVTMSGRQFYNQIASLPDIEEKVKSYKKNKGSAEVEPDLLG